jgi:hypothetical protein
MLLIFRINAPYKTTFSLGHFRLTWFIHSHGAAISGSHEPLILGVS